MRIFELQNDIKEQLEADVLLMETCAVVCAATVLVDHEGVMLHWKGGTVAPTRAKALAIPLAPALLPLFSRFTPLRMRSIVDALISTRSSATCGGIAATRSVQSLTHSAMTVLKYVVHMHSASFHTASGLADLVEYLAALAQAQA